MELLEKIRLADGTELTLVPMGTDRKDKIFILSVFAEIDYSELESVLINANNISKIQHLNSVGEVLTIYTDCIGLNRISKDIKGYTDGEIVKDVYTIELSKDANLVALRNIEKELATVKENKLESDLETDYRLCLIELGLI